MKKKALCFLGNRSDRLLLLLDKNSYMNIVKFNDLKQVLFSLNEYSFILTDGFGKISYKALFLSYLTNKPIVSRTRGDFFQEIDSVSQQSMHFFSKLRLKLRKKIAFWHLSRSEEIICNSKYTYKAYRDHYPLKKISIVYNPCICNRVLNKIKNKKQKKGLTLFSVSNFDIEKKISLLIKSILNWIPAGFMDEYCIKWIICGDGKYLTNFRSQLQNNPSLKSRVILKGYINNLDELYDQSDVFVHISGLDAFPNVTLDAMMHEMPLIVNKESCGTLEQVNHGINGYIVNSQNELIKYLIKYLDSALREKHGKEGRKLVEQKFSIDSQKKKMQEILKTYL